ncbi:MAG: CrcB family protein [Bdellovibrionales bacterium]
MFALMSIAVFGIVGLGIRHVMNTAPFLSPAGALLSLNVAGSLVAGYLGGLKSDHVLVTAGIVGFCGCLTTFSGYALINVKWFEQGEFFKIGLHFFLNNALCLSMCYVGWRIASKS